ncbi:MAG TPA: hypothetical protein VHO23_03200 [Candidatus Paceibacterota bacterium]|nr:hypothetical protein [Candidatus Paceibacterota bacterium]
MAYIIAVAVALVLFGGFVALASCEAGAGRRFLLAGPRKSLDRKVARVAFILDHVDLGAFMRDTVRDGIERVLHDVAHASLLAVRFLERALTRFVRRLREKRDGASDASLKERLLEVGARLRRAITLRRIAIQRKDERK